MAKGYKAKKRNSFKRKRKSIILVATEGNNKTEKQYLQGFRNLDKRIVFAKGNYTDPENMMANLRSEYDKLELSQEDGDIGYCIVDMDVSEKQEKAIAKADKKADSQKLKVIVSNPSIEVWFLCHFRYTSKQFASAADVIKELKKDYPEYDKSSPDVFDKLKEKIDVARENAILLEQNAVANGFKPHIKGFLPSTELYKVVDTLLK